MCPVMAEVTPWLALECWKEGRPLWAHPYPMAPISMVSQLLSLESLGTLSPHLGSRDHQVLLSLPSAPSHPLSLPAVCRANSSASLTSSSPAPPPPRCSNVQHCHEGAKLNLAIGALRVPVYKPTFHASTFYIYTFAQVFSLA